MLDLIYCGGGNPRLSQIAYEEGWLLGVRSDKSTLALPQSFVDVDYKKPDFERHLEIVAKYQPRYATVPDLPDGVTRQSDVDRALKQAERLAPYCEVVLIVPKLPQQLALLPAHIAIGYSVPSSYGGSQIPLWELTGRSVHLLGGSPKKQMQIYLHLSAIATVMSADGNYAHRQAVKHAEYWDKRWIKHPEVKMGKRDLYFECWRRSCRNLMNAWRRLAS